MLVYKQCNSDHILIVYVDDFIITRNNDEEATKLEKFLNFMLKNKEH